jgi:hypothetical protein
MKNFFSKQKFWIAVFYYIIIFRRALSHEDPCDLVTATTDALVPDAQEAGMI